VVLTLDGFLTTEFAFNINFKEIKNINDNCPIGMDTGTSSGGNSQQPQQQQPPQEQAQPQPQEMTANPGIDLGSIYTQCSLSRSAANTVSVTEIKDGVVSTTAATATPIGSLNWEGDPTVKKTFHGGRISKNGRVTNECISLSFDPRNLHCLGCEVPHSIFNPLKPVVMIFADQNFVPFLSGGPDNCIGICRAENPTLSELADLAAEIIDRTPLPAGTTLLFGSGSHLYRAGTSQYAADWITLSHRCSQKWPNVNICPLIPLTRSDCPGHYARDIMTLACWLSRVYANSTTGILDTWKLILRWTDEQCEKSETADIIKIPLPSSISVGSVTSHTHVYYSSCPDILKGMDRKATAELIRTLIETLNRDFSANLNPDIIIANSWAGTGKSDTADPDVDSEMETGTSNHLVVVGSSNMKRLIPIFIAAGYTVSDLTCPSWLATSDNIELVLSQIESLALEPGYTIVMEMFGNSTFRYHQFDGTMALPYRSQKGYHMPGKIGVCEKESFTKTVVSVKDIINVNGPGVRIIIPPLPRYLFKGCCGQSDHSTNLNEEGYSLNLLAATMQLRPLLKNVLLDMGAENFFVLDGVGALLGIPPGGNRGPPAELLADLEKVTAADNVHFTELGYKNLCNTILAADAKIRDGTLTKSIHAQTGSALSDGSTVGGTKATFFWRGFASPVGHSTTAGPISGKFSWPKGGGRQGGKGRPDKSGPWRGGGGGYRGHGGHGAYRYGGGGGRRHPKFYPY
jgi:hypothetical protein